MTNRQKKVACWDWFCLFLE